MLVAMLVAVLVFVFLVVVAGFGLLVFMGFFFFQVACILMLKRVTMGVSPMEHLVHHDVDDQSSTGSDEHHKRSFHVLAGNDPF